MVMRTPPFVRWGVCWPDALKPRAAQFGELDFRHGDALLEIAVKVVLAAWLANASLFVALPL